MDNDLAMITIVAVTLIGLFAAILYYFLRFFFQAGRYDEEIEASSSSELSPSPLSPTETPEKISPPVKDLSAALAPTRASLFGRIKSLFKSDHELTPAEKEELEEILYTSDLGPKTVQRLMEAIEQRIKDGGEGTRDMTQLEKVREALKAEMLDIFSGVGSSDSENQEDSPSSEEMTNGSLTQVLRLERTGAAKPLVWLIVGVNGVGKTTTIGKLAHAVAKAGKKVIVAAGDTFRAAAGDQLKVWSERAQVEIFSPQGVTDPSAVAFDACQMAQARGYDVVIVDTAGRLHTQANLMEELRKMKRVVQKVIPDGPHETWLVLDANSGQNALMQARQFHEILELSGVVLTKLDGTAKGGVAVGLADELHLPIRLIGVGEGIEDLRPFHSQEFVHSIL